jgi:hypothetical protein
LLQSKIALDGAGPSRKLAALDALVVPEKDENLKLAA